MLTYKAMYKSVEGVAHGEVLDVPGTITVGKDLDDARAMLASALADMAETNLLAGESLPRPDPSITGPEADIEEPIHLLLTAANRVQVAPEAVTASRP